LSAEIHSRSAVFETFLTSLEKVSRGIADRSYDDQAKITEMSKFVWELASWRVFATFTFRWSASVESARRCFERFVRRSIPNVSFFFAIELHPGGHGGHVHALFDRDDFPRKAVWSAWKKRYGVNRVEPIKGFQNVCDYVAKYVVKDHSWWNFSLNRAAWQRFQKREIFLPLSFEKNFGGDVCDPLLPFDRRSTEP